MPIIYTDPSDNLPSTSYPVLAWAILIGWFVLAGLAVVMTSTGA